MTKAEKGAALVALVAFLLSLKKTGKTPIDPGSLKGLYYGKLVSDEFGAKLLGVASRLGLDPDDLMTVFRIERGAKGGKLGPGVYHSYTDKDGTHTGDFGYGLFGISPGTAKWLGTSPEELYKMSDVDQLDIVERYYIKHGWNKGGNHEISSFNDVYSGVWGGQTMIDAKPGDAIITKAKQPEIYEQWVDLAGKRKDTEWLKKGFISKQDVLDLANKFRDNGRKNAR